MNCPKCRVPLHSKDIEGEGITLEYCKKCKGWWFDPKELAHMANTWLDLPSSSPKQFRETNLNCPRCEGSMIAFHYDQKEQSIMIDQCTACKGIWLDREEFQRISRLNRSLRKAATHPMEHHGLLKIAGLISAVAGLVGLIFILMTYLR